MLTTSSAMSRRFYPLRVISSVTQDPEANKSREFFLMIKTLFTIYKYIARQTFQKYIFPQKNLIKKNKEKLIGRQNILRIPCALKTSSVQHTFTPWDAVQSPRTLCCQTSSALGRAAQPPDAGSFPWACLWLHHLVSLTFYLGLSSTDSSIFGLCHIYC